MVFHGIDQPRAVDELPLAANQGVVKFWDVLGRYRKVGVENHQHLAPGLREPLAHRIALARSVLLRRLDVEIGIGLDHALDFAPGTVLTAALHEQDFQVVAEPGQALHRGLDITALVTAGDENGCRKTGLFRIVHGTGHQIIAQTESPHTRQHP